MKKIGIISIALTGWFAVVTQYYLMMENRVDSVGESTIRFFSFFTILTNSLVMLYFTYRSLQKKEKTTGFFNRQELLTAITIYITIVGLVYQIALRHIWSPVGLQKLVDELLHTVIPVLVIVYWYFYANKSILQWRSLLFWFIYPFVYLIYVLIRGSFSGFYPYPFLNVSIIGWQQTLVNSGVIALVFVVVSALFIGLGRVLAEKNK